MMMKLGRSSSGDVAIVTNDDPMMVPSTLRVEMDEHISEKRDSYLWHGPIRIGRIVRLVVSIWHWQWKRAAYFW